MTARTKQTVYLKVKQRYDMISVVLRNIKQEAA